MGKVKNPFVYLFSKGFPSWATKRQSDISWISFTCKYFTIFFIIATIFYLFLIAFKLFLQCGAVMGVCVLMCWKYVQKGRLGLFIYITFVLSLSHMKSTWDILLFSTLFSILCSWALQKKIHFLIATLLWGLLREHGKLTRRCFIASRNEFCRLGPPAADRTNADHVSQCFSPNFLSHLLIP